MKDQCFREKITGILISLYCIPVMGIMVFLFLQSLLKTTYFELYQTVEAPYYKSDHPFITLPAAILFFFLLRWFHKRTDYFTSDTVRLKNWYLYSAGSFCLLFILMFRGTATADSMALSEIAGSFLAGDGSALQEGGYLSVYPFQLGMVTFLQLIWFLFGYENYMAFQLINMTAILFILYLLNKITEELFDSKEVCRYEEILSAGMLPLFLYTTFVYGDIVGLAFGIGAVYHVVRYIRGGSRFGLVWAVLFMGLAVLLKSNYTIIMIATIIALLLKWVREGAAGWRTHIVRLAAIAGLVCFPQILYRLLGMIYCMAFGIESMPPGAPKILWIAMSLQKEAPFEYGWYNGYNTNTYAEYGQNGKLAAAAAMASIRDSLANFISHPRFALTFFYRKFVSQWNAPCFQSLITNEWSSRHSENLSMAANTLLLGMGRRILSQFMNFYQLIMYGSVLAFFIPLLKKIRDIRLEQAYLVLCVLGGMLFHLIWEAQSRYALPYFILMLPMAADGMALVSNRIDINRFMKKKNMSD